MEEVKDITHECIKQIDYMINFSQRSESRFYALPQLDEGHTRYNLECFGIQVTFKFMASRHT